MKNARNKIPRDELREEYTLDYSKSKSNRFAAKLKGTTAVVLQPDVAEVFRSSKAVNDLLRSAITATSGTRADSRSSSRSRSTAKGCAA